MRYRRARIAGGTYFFTLVLADRRERLLLDYADVLRDVIRHARLMQPFAIDAMVVLPDHLHAIWTLPAGDSDYPGRWHGIKASFARRLPPTEPRSASQQRRGERGIWQRRYWEHAIRDGHDLQQHLDYVHYNPVKHGYVARPVDWPFSSIHRFIRSGLMSPDWAAGPQTDWSAGE